MKSRLITSLFILTAGIWLLRDSRPEPAARAITPDQTRMTTPEIIKAALGRGEIDQGTANLYLAYAIFDDQQLPDRFRGVKPWDGTLPLLQLRTAVSKMPSSTARSTIQTLITATCSSSTGALPNTTTSPHFFIEYDTIGGGLTVNDYKTSLETTWSQEVDTFGWAAPPMMRGDGRYHVRIDSLGASLYGYVDASGTYAGFVGNNPNTPWNDVDAYASCMVLNRDYTGFGSPPQASLDATTAHEFNHSLQFGYGALGWTNVPETVFIEGGATWMEDEVFDNANDNYLYLWPDYASCMNQYNAGFAYPYWIVFRGLTEPHGTGTAGGGEQIMQDFWELVSKGTANNAAALDQALQTAGTNLADAYHAAAIAEKFNQPCGGGYSAPYCLEEGSGYVNLKGDTAVHGAIAGIGSSYNGSLADGYALNWISLPTGALFDITLQNNSAGGELRGSLACDTGSTLAVTPFTTTLSGPGATTLIRYNSSGCDTAVAIITNQAPSSSCTSRSYTLSTELPTALNNKLFMPQIINQAP